MPDLLANKAKQVRRAAMCVALVFWSVLNVACTPLSSALVDSAKGLAFDLESASTSEAPHMQQEQLRMTVMKSVFYITRVHSAPAALTQESAQGQDGLWVTPAGEVLRISEAGRLVGSTGSAYADWSRVHTTPIPNWRVIRNQLESGHVVQYMRHRDVEPRGYAGLQDKVSIHLVNEPLDFNNFVHKDKSSLIWFEERSNFIDTANRLKKNTKVLKNNDPLSMPLPVAKFAVSFKENKNGEVVFSEQCMSALVCFSLQKLTEKNNY